MTVSSYHKVRYKFTMKNSEVKKIYKGEFFFLVFLDHGHGHGHGHDLVDFTFKMTIIHIAESPP